jgi:molecular chaperone GrpE
MPDPLAPDATPDNASPKPGPSGPDEPPHGRRVDATAHPPVPGGSGPDSSSLLAALQKDRDDLEARLLRVSADYQNFARRSQQNILEARQQEVRSMSRSLLSVLDHFDRALNVDLTKSDPRTLLDGLRIVRDELLKTLEQFGVRRIAVKPGDEFDPHLHEAVLHQPAQGVAPNHVTLELESGYLLDDFTLRPAKVAVAPESA